MNDSDRKLLALLALGVGLVWVSSMHFGDSFGLPGVTSAPPAKRTPKRPAASSSGRAAAPGSGGDGVIDVSSPHVVSLEQYKAQQAARARAARARKP